MKRDVFTDEEKRYMYQFQPLGFHRVHNALYDAKCFRQWTLGRMVWAALERGNRMPSVSVVQFPDGLFRGALPGRFTGWSIAIPIGIGTLTAWGYVERCRRRPV